MGDLFVPIFFLEHHVQKWKEYPFETAFFAISNSMRSSNSCSVKVYISEEQTEDDEVLDSLSSINFSTNVLPFLIKTYFSFQHLVSNNMLHQVSLCYISIFILAFLPFWKQ